MKQVTIAALLLGLVGCTGGEAPPLGDSADSTSVSHKPYPIVLAHGFSGFRNIGPLDYFFGVADVLTRDGHQVFTAQVDPFNDSFVRGAELQAFVSQVLAETGAAKVNLICHSQGGTDCRYVAAHLGGRIGAVVTIATPHRGDFVADVALGVLPGALQDALAALLELFGDNVLDPNGNVSSDALAAVRQLSTDGAAAFNAVVKDDPRVAYFSIAGRSNLSFGGSGCSSANAPSFVSQYRFSVDAVNPLLLASDGILAVSAFPPPVTDGLVALSSAKWGTFLGCIPADHLDQVCQIAGQWPGSNFDCHGFYRDLANWLVSKGF